VHLAPAGGGADAEGATPHGDGGDNTDNTPPEMGSGFSPPPGGGGVHNGTSPRAGGATAVDDAALL